MIEPETINLGACFCCVQMSNFMEVSAVDLSREGGRGTLIGVRRTYPLLFAFHPKFIFKQMRFYNGGCRFGPVDGATKNSASVLNTEEVLRKRAERFISDCWRKFPPNVFNFSRRSLCLESLYSRLHVNCLIVTENVVEGFALPVCSAVFSIARHHSL